MRQERSNVSVIELLSVGCLIVLACYLMVPAVPQAEIDPDEGLNVIKALLVSQGYHLYADIWSDQPPLFTVVLSFWMDSAGLTLAAARQVVFGFVTLLLLSLYLLVRQTASCVAGLLSVALLLVSSNFLKAAGAVMVGLPAISLVLFSVFLVARSSRSKSSERLVVASSAAFAAAILTKFFIVVFLPAIGWGVLRSSEGVNKKVVSRFHAGIIWILCFSATFLLLGYLLEPALLEHLWSQLLSPHRSGSKLISWDSRPMVINMLQHDKALVLLALAAILLGAFKKNTDIILPFLCLLGGALFLALHQPIWWHHYLLVSVPLCWLAGIGAAAGVNELQQIKHFNGRQMMLALFGLGIAGGLIFFAARLPERVDAIYTSINQGRRGFEGEIIEQMQAFKSQTRWVVTDRPVYAFNISKPVPPELAVISSKRFQSGFLTALDVRRVIERYQPEQVLLSRFPHLKKIIPGYIAEDYRLLVSAGESSLYLRRDLDDVE